MEHSPVPQACNCPLPPPVGRHAQEVFLSWPDRQGVGLSVSQ
jgi:hypothetical protein